MGVALPGSRPVGLIHSNILIFKLFFPILLFLIQRFIKASSKMIQM